MFKTNNHSMMKKTREYLHRYKFKKIGILTSYYVCI